MLATVGAVALTGLDARHVRVETDTSPGLPNLRIVGRPDPTVRESGDRVRAAVQRSGHPWPQMRIVCNLSPADLPKIGSGFDLPFALGILASSGRLPAAVLEGVVAVGELGLDGSVRPVGGTLPVAREAVRRGARLLLVSESAAVEAALAAGDIVVPVVDLREAIAVLTGEQKPRPVPDPVGESVVDLADLADVRGQHVARRALEVAATGGHHTLLVGPPGCGKSMLARRLRGLLPDLTPAHALEAATVASVAGMRPPDAPLSRRPPFRAPHHGTSLAGLVGGGSGIPRPGEVSLAHRGVLFLDEALETPRHVLDGLRQPIERGEVVLSRAQLRVRYPARFQLILAANPCPCGREGDLRRPCTCRPDLAERYRARLSGPLLDRLDLHVRLRPVERSALAGPTDGESSAVVAARVAAGRDFGRERRAAGHGDALSPDTAGEDVERLRSTVRPDALRDAIAAIDVLGLTARSLGSVLRVARTLADLDAVENVSAEHVDEAVAHRATEEIAG